MSGTTANLADGPSPRVGADPVETHRRLTPWMLGVAGVTFLAGLLFGYDQGVISVALPLISKDLGLNFRVPETRGRSLEEIQALWVPEQSTGA